MAKFSAEAFQEAIRKDPVVFFDCVLGATHWSKQDEIARSAFRNQRTTVKSCHGIGKSYVAARIVLAFLFAHPDSVVVTTAPTFRQVENILWREIRAAAKKSVIPLGGNLLKTKYEIDEKWYAIGLSSDKEDNFQGFHANNLLVVADEAGGIVEKTLTVMEALLTSEGSRLLYIGNPTKASGGFYESHKSSAYHRISIPCFDTPNFTISKIRNVGDLKKMTREEVAALPLVYPELITPLWVYDRIESWGETSAIFQSRVLAVFPEEGNDTLIRLSDLEAALEKEWDGAEWARRPRRNSIGIDVARFGGDTTVLIAMDNGRMREDIVAYNGKDTMVTVGHAIALFNSLGFMKEFDTFVVDDTGVGGGVTDRLVELGYNVIPVNNASSASDTEKFRDIKAEIYWMLRLAFINGEIRIHDVGRLIKDISNVKYDYMSNGTIFIKSKKKMKEEGLDSPDYADALALAYYGSSVVDGGDAVIGDDDGAGESRTVTGGVMRKKF